MTDSKSFVTGTGSSNADLTEPDFRKILDEALLNVKADSRVLAIISDKTCDDNTPRLFPIAAEILAQKKISKLNAHVVHVAQSPSPHLI